MITVLGSSGFIGRHLVKKLEELHMEYLSPKREDSISQIPLGDIIYCIGLTADSRWRPLEAVEAHVCKLLEVLNDCQFDSILYLSSARVYDRSLQIAREDAQLQVQPLDREHLYDMSKIMGEALLFASGRRIRVARLSNVYGPDFESDTFLSSIIKEALAYKKVRLRTSGDSGKDYISIEDAVAGLIKIATQGRHAIYNLASGKNTPNQALIEKISRLTGCDIEYAPDAERISFPPISIDRMTSEFSFRPSNLLDDMNQIVDLYRNARKSWDDQNRH